MKRILGAFLYLVCGVFVALQAQDLNKTSLVLRMGDFKSVEPLHERFLDMIKAKVSEVATASGRFTVLDDEMASAESQYMMREDFMDLPDEKRREILEGLLNDYTLYCNITKCKFTKKTGGANGYTCVVTLKLSVVNAASDKAEVADERSFVSNFKNMIVKNTKDAALDDALQSMTEKMTNYFVNNFAVYGTITKYDGNEVVINCGQNQGIKKGDTFQVKYVTMAKDGTQTNVPVGIIKVKELMPDGTSTCGISDGKDGIIEKFQNSSSTSWLQCKLILK